MLTLLKKVEANLRRSCQRIDVPDYIRASRDMVRQVIECLEEEERIRVAVLAPGSVAVSWNQDKLKKLREYLPDSLFDTLFTLHDGVYKERSPDAIKCYMEFADSELADGVRWCMEKVEE